MNGRLRHAVSGLLILLGSGCSTESKPFKVDMGFQATNTADHILVVEGKTNLPAGTPLKAELQTRDGRVLLRDSDVVSHEKFYFDFDLKGLDGLSLYQVKVRFDPQTAPLGVRQVTGMWGEQLEGSGVKEVDKRRVVERKVEVILTAGTQGGQDWEGRDFSSMEISERSRLIAQLEKVLEEKPDDRNAKLALARAYIAADPRELASGTRAFALLKEVTSRADDHLTALAQKMVAGVEVKEEQTKVKAEQRKTLARGDKFRKEKTIWPGRSVGAFNLGTPYRILQRHLKLSTPPDFSDPDREAIARPDDIPGLELRFDSRSRRISSIRITSESFQLPEKLGVGNLLQELQAAYGKEAVPTPQFRYEKTKADGHAIYRGVVVASGLEFEIVRSVDPVFGLPVDKVVAITVFPAE